MNENLNHNQLLEFINLNEELQTLNRIIIKTNELLCLQSRLDFIIDEALRVVGLEGGTVCLINPDNTFLLAVHRETSEATIADLSEHEIKVGDCLCGNCAKECKPLILNTHEEVLAYATREVLRGEDIRFHAAYPFIIGGKCIGVLCVFTRTDKKPSERSLKFLETIVAQTAVLVDNAGLYEKMQESDNFNRTLFEQSVIGLALARMNGELVDVNQAYANIIGRTIEETQQLSYWDITPEKYAQQEQKQMESLNSTGKYGPYEKEYIHREGHLVPVRLQGQIIERNAEKFIWSSVEDITERKHTELLLASEKQWLELVSSGAPLGEVLYEIVKKIEELSNDTIGSILLLDPDGVHVHYGAAPNLPEAYNRALEGLEIGPAAGSCGTAAYRKETVIVTDIDTDPLWDDYRELAQTHRLRACWSTPIMTSDGKVLGTFAMYYREPRGPNQGDFKLIERATHVAGIAIERKRAEVALRESEEKFSAIFKAAPGSMILSSLPDGKTVEVNNNFTLITGYSRDEALGKTTGDLNMWTDSSARDQFLTILQTKGVVRDFEADLNHKSGSILNGLVSGHIISIDDKKYLIGTFYDITERKRTEEALRKSEEKFSVTFKKAPFAAGLTNLSDGTFLEVNEEFERKYGFSREEVIGKTTLELGIQPDPEIRLQSLELIRKQGFVHNLDMRLKTRTGEIYDVLINSDLVEIGGEKFILTTANDITERKRAEKLLMESEKKLRRLIDGLGPYMFVGLMKPDGILIEANLPALAAAGLKAEDVLNKPFEETYWWAYSESVKKQLHKAIENATKGEPSRYDVEVRVREGIFITIDFSLQPLRDEDGNVEYLIPSAIVITERKRAEEALKQSEAHWQSYVSNAPNVIFTVDRDYKITFMNYTMPGYSTSDVIGMSMFNYLPEESREIAKRTLDRVFETGERQSYEVLGYGKHGEPAWYSTSVGPIIKDGEVVSLILIATDITERKQAEEKIIEQLNELKRWQDVMIGRETRNIELKHEVNELMKQLGKPEKYKS